MICNHRRELLRSPMLLVPAHSKLHRQLRVVGCFAQACGEVDDYGSRITILRAIPIRQNMAI